MKISKTKHVTKKGVVKKNPTGKIQKNLEATRRAYADAQNNPRYTSDMRNLNWKSDWLTVKQAEKIIKVVEYYNAFDSDDVYNSLKQFDGQVMVQFAREGSVCLYVKGDNENVLNHVSDVFKGYADENDFEKNGQLRLWWD